MASQLQERVQLLGQKNKGLNDDVTVQKIQIRQLEDDLNKAKGEKEQVRSMYQGKIEVIDHERLSFSSPPLRLR